MISKLGQIQPWTVELAALDQLKTYFTYLRTIKKYLLSGERSLPFGLLVSSPKPKAHGELTVYQSSRRLSVCMCVSVHTFKHEYL